MSAYDFLRDINLGKRPDLKGKKVVVIGAGNVGMDAASEAYNNGAESVVAVDIQKPAAFGAEMEIARAKGTQVIWPKFTERFDRRERKVFFQDGTSLDADFVVMSIGDVPQLDFLPQSVHTERGWIPVNNKYQTSDVKVYAIGDVTGLGLVTHAIGHGRLAADYIHYELMHAPRNPEITADDRLREDQDGVLRRLPWGFRLTRDIREPVHVLRHVQRLPHVRVDLLLGSHQQG